MRVPLQFERDDMTLSSGHRVSSVSARARAHSATPNRHIEFYFAPAPHSGKPTTWTTPSFPPVPGCNDYNIRLAVAICESTHNQYRRPNCAHARDRTGELCGGPRCICWHRPCPPPSLQPRWSIAESSARVGRAGVVEKCKCIDAFGSNGLPFGR